MNMQTLVGYIAKDPKLSMTASNGVPVANFVVIDNVDTGKGVKEPIGFKCVLFGMRAEALCKAVGKGDKLVVTGETIPNNYEDKEGKLIYSTQLRVNTVDWVPLKKVEQ